ncbi:lysozyme inhibitor LprI family protein [Xanthomonas sp. NCPPB 2632]|uniref:lysozyme inhibitor LprI family protein n=1 Tax=Xanthomonas sp. NCPPB 2632 TaxID=3240912 RepID=UPI0035140CBA
MIRRSLGLLLVALSMQAAGLAHGQENAAADPPLRPAYYTCVKASRGVTLALNDCIGNEHDFQDKRLNTAYQNLRKSLSDVKRTALRDEERAWIGRRDKTCAPDASGGTASLLDSNQCQLDQTAARAAALEARTGQ